MNPTKINCDLENYLRMEFQDKFEEVLNSVDFESFKNICCPELNIKKLRLEITTVDYAGPKSVKTMDFDVYKTYHKGISGDNIVEAFRFHQA
jgi:hypothetical protein